MLRQIVDISELEEGDFAFEFFVLNPKFGERLDEINFWIFLYIDVLLSS